MMKSVQLAVLVFVVVCVGADWDPEIDATTADIIRRWGYPVEEWDATTDDGYVLTMQRIPYGQSGPSPNRPVIFLQHGLEDSSFSWVANLPSQSAAFIFADAGFDVWLGNMRGNPYSLHQKFSVDNENFWHFSFDEMVKYDLPAMINGILELTNQSSLYYVGHSQGTLTMFALLSQDPTFHTKIREFFALAPVGHVANIQGLIEYIAHYASRELNWYYYWFGDNEFFPSAELFSEISKYLCKLLPVAEFCDNLMMLIMGADVNQMNVTRTPVYLSHVPAGTSTRNIIHWVQMVQSGQLAAYDFGSASKNQDYYGSPTPPIYDVSLVNAKVHLFWSADDWLADAVDIMDFLIPSLPKKSLVANHQLDDFNHIDFLWGMGAADQIYQPILDAINQDLKERELQSSVDRLTRNSTNPMRIK